MILEIKDIYILNKKTFTAKNQCYVIDYCYLNKRGEFEINHAYIDENAYNSIDIKPSIDKNGALNVSRCFSFRGHYVNYKFVADEIVNKIA